MNYEQRDTYGIYKGTSSIGSNTHLSGGPGPQLMGADTLIGNNVCNQDDEDLGDIKEIMLDVSIGRVAYAVLSRIIEPQQVAFSAWARSCSLCRGAH